MRLHHQVEGLASELRREAVAPGVMLRHKSLMLASAEVIESYIRGDAIPVTMEEQKTAVDAAEAKRLADAEAAAKEAGIEFVPPPPVLHEDVFESSHPGAATREFHNAPAGLERPVVPGHARSARTGMPAVLPPLEEEKLPKIEQPEEVFVG